MKLDEDEKEFYEWADRLITWPVIILLVTGFIYWFGV